MIAHPDYAEFSVIELAAKITSRAMSAYEVVRDSLERIEHYDGKIGAFVHVDAQGAITAALEIDQRIKNGEPVGPLAGVPFGVKDFSHVRGMPTFEGTSALGAGAIAEEDEPMVARLRVAGAIPIGKTNVPEFGLHSATYNERFGVTRNPWDLSKTPGGSSGGSSAAVSAGLVPFATGSDGGGSIRTPAAFCGLVGLKPTTALVPSASGRDRLSCLGFLTRTVADTARLLDVSGGAHPSDRRSVSMPDAAFETAIARMSVEGRSIAWSPDFGYAPMEDEVVGIAKAAFDRLVKQAGLSVLNIDIALPNIYRAWISDALNFLQLQLTESDVNPCTLDMRTQGFLSRFSVADPMEHIRVQGAFDHLERELSKLFTRVDLIATPATACAAFGADEEIPDQINGKDATWTGAEPLSMFANVAGCPAISIPAGLTAAGLPVGLQIAAPRFEDAALLRLAKLFEDVAPWPHLAPAFAGVRALNE